MSRWRRAPKQLHVRFARGYQIGLLVGIILGGGVWFSTQAGLDIVADGAADASAARLVVDDTRSVGAVLGEVEDAPLSLVLRSDLARHLATLEGDWYALLDDPDQPDDVAALLEGADGLADDIDQFLRDAAPLAIAGSEGIFALDEADRALSSRLEDEANRIADRSGLIVESYEARAAREVDGMRLSSHLAFGFSVVFLAALVGILLRPLKEQLRSESSALRDATAQHKSEAERQELAAHLSDGLEAAETEDEAHLVVSRAFDRLVPDRPIEMLLSASERGELEAAVVHPRNGGVGCQVDSTWACPAVRRGRTMIYDDSEAVNACPHLADRPGGRCSATCVPVSFMGQSMGVIHTVGEAGETLPRGEVDVLGLVASQVSIRLGTLRSFAQVEMQAATDPLTGLPNRRATEDRLDRLLADDAVGTVAMADLDRFSLLNDRYGQEAGDRALRMFADAVRESLRDDDWIGRWGGEEFILVLPGMTGGQAKEALDRVRERLAEACVRAEAPSVTVSMGLVDTELATDVDEIVRLADDALLAAKTQGRDRVVVGPVMSSLGEAFDSDDEIEPSADSVVT